MASPPQNSSLMFSYLVGSMAGLTTQQVAGIVANAWAESSVNPEASATDSNGLPSSGLLQWNAGSYPQLYSGGRFNYITGNLQNDMKAQVSLILGSPYFAQYKQATAGASPEVCASWWAANFERCQGCEPGGAANQQRQAMAAEIYNAAVNNQWQGTPGAAPDVSGAAGGGQATPIDPFAGIEKTLSSVFAPLADIAKFFTKIGEGITWIRIGEVIIGTVCLATGTIIFLALLFPNMSRTLSSSAGALSMVMGPAAAAKGLIK